MSNKILVIIRYYRSNKAATSLSCQALPVTHEQDVEIKEVHKDFNTEDIREAVKSASEIIRNLEKEVVPEHIELGRQFRELMERLAGTGTAYRE